MESKPRYSGIKNLLFDLGGVIIDLRRESCIQALTNLGMSGAEQMLGLYAQSGIFGQLESGQIDQEEFYRQIRPYFPDNGSSITDSQIRDAFNEFLVGIPLHRLVELRTLRRYYRIFLLSNTNPIMIESRIAELFAAEGRSMADYFDGMILSYQAHCLKPSAQIFEYTAATLNIVPAETLFLDDSQANLDAAARSGFATALVAPGTEFIDALTCINPDE